MKISSALYSLKILPWITALFSQTRKIIRINLVPQEKERIIEIIREVEKIPFIKAVEPNMIYSTSND